MRHLLAVVALAAASHAHAAIPDGLTTTCSGAFSQSWSDAIVLDCAGDLSLVGTQADVRLESATSISLRADGMLQLLDLTLVAPTIDLQAGTALNLLNTVLLSDGATVGVPTPPAGGNIGIGGSGGIRPGGSIGVPGNLNPPVIAVPEPSTWALLLAGLATVALRRRAPASARH